MKAFGHGTRVFALHFSQILENRFFVLTVNTGALEMASVKHEFFFRRR